MNCEKCDYAMEERWPKGRTALRCFGPIKFGPGRVVNIYPSYYHPKTEAPIYCPKRRQEEI